MTAWYPVKSGGLATGDEGRVTSQPTGSFATLTTEFYYDNRAAAYAATTPPTSDDEIISSDSHSHQYTANTTFAGPTTGNFLKDYSVDDSNMDAYKAGASETTSGSSFDLIFQGRIVVTGVNFSPTDDFVVSSSNSHLIYADATLTFANTTGDRPNVGTDGCSMTFYDIIITGVGAHSPQIGNGSTFTQFGGAWTTSGTWAGIINATASGNGGMHEYLTGVDLSAISGYLFPSVGGSTSDDAIDVVVRGCQLGTLTGFMDEAFTQPHQRLLVVNSSATSAAAEYQYFESTWLGTVEDQDDAGIHRVGSTAFADSSKKVSYTIITTAFCSKQTPLVVEVPMRFAVLSSTSTDKIDSRFVSTTTLTDTNFYPVAYYPDGTNKNVWNINSAATSPSGTWIGDPLAAGTEHTDDSGSSVWKNGGSDLTTENEYIASNDTVGDAGADSVPTVQYFVGIASTTINLDSELGLST